MSEVLEQIEEYTPRYGTILFSNVKGKGWTYQYDSVLVFGNEDYDMIPRCLSEDTVESGEMIPELDELEDNAFYKTYNEAYNAMLGDMSNAYRMGTIAVFM